MSIIVRFLARNLRRMVEGWADYWVYGLHRPRRFLLERAHVGAAWWVYLLAALGACVVLHIAVPAGAVPAVVVLAVPGMVLDVGAFGAHLLWSIGRLWQDTVCPCCGDRGDDGDDSQDDDDGPDDPEDHGLTAEDLRILDLISDGVLTAGPTTEEMP